MSLSSAIPGPSGRLCVYSCLFGQYEDLTQQPNFGASPVDWVLFTDQPSLRSSTWQIRVVDAPVSDNAALASRHPKVFPERYLPEYDRSIYIDNSVRLLKPPDLLWNEVAFGGDGFVVQHSYRRRLIDEFAAVWSSRLGEPEAILKVYEEVRAFGGELLAGPVYWGGLIGRVHTAPSLTPAMSDWWRLIRDFSARDQLSLPLVLGRNEWSPTLVSMDNFRSPWHEWPVAANRRVTVRDGWDDVPNLPLPLQLAIELYELKEYWEQKLRAEREATGVAPQGSTNPSSPRQSR